MVADPVDHVPVALAAHVLEPVQIEVASPPRRHEREIEGRLEDLAQSLERGAQRVRQPVEQSRRRPRARLRPQPHLPHAVLARIDAGEDGREQLGTGQRADRHAGPLRHELRHDGRDPRVDAPRVQAVDAAHEQSAERRRRPGGGSRRGGGRGERARRHRATRAGSAGTNTALPRRWGAGSRPRSASTVGAKSSSVIVPAAARHPGSASTTQPRSEGCSGR
jgi:hypothetical protein